MKVAIFGPGAIGGFVGVCLSAGGASVDLIGRAHRSSSRESLRVAQTADGERLVPAHELLIGHDPQIAEQCDVAIVAVKSRDTEGVAEVLAQVLRPDALVVSFQNGLSNPRQLRARLDQRIAAGVVGFNVVSHGDCRRQATRGNLFIEHVEHPSLSPLLAAFSGAGQAAETVADINAIQCGKLLLNLHNGVSAATGLGTWNTLTDLAARRCYALCLREGLKVLRASGERPASPVPIPLWLLPHALSLPTALVTMGARRAVPEGGEATSSTLVDLRAGKKTEIDDLNGAIVSRAKILGRSAPANETVCRLVHSLEQQSALRFLSSQELEHRITVASRSA